MHFAARTRSRESGTGNQAFLTINGGVVDFTADANLGAVPSATDNGTALIAQRRHTSLQRHDDHSHSPPTAA